jgi:hypothetical protein
MYNILEAWFRFISLCSPIYGFSVKLRLYTYSCDFSTENLCDLVCGAGYSAEKSRLFGNIRETTESPRVGVHSVYRYKYYMKVRCCLYLPCN